MPPSHPPTIPKAPQPTKIFFDPFNSSATGHQRAENRLSGSTSWRDSRTHKLAHQFQDRSGAGGQGHLSDLVGAGSENFGKDGRKDNGGWGSCAPGLREKGLQDIRGLLGNTRKRSGDSVGNDVLSKKRRDQTEALATNDELAGPATITQSASAPAGTANEQDEGNEPPQIFRGLTMYLNGSTMPLVSDHRLKQLWVQHGGNASIAVGRRTVTHVILGERGAGGGLAAGKIQKENSTIRGKGIKYVSVQWVLDSIEKGIRQPEARYAAADVKDKLGGSRQASVATLFAKKGE